MGQGASGSACGIGRGGLKHLHKAWSPLGEQSACCTRGCSADLRRQAEAYGLVPAPAPPARVDQPPLDPNDRPVLDDDGGKPPDDWAEEAVRVPPRRGLSRREPEPEVTTTAAESAAELSRCACCSSLFHSCSDLANDTYTTLHIAPHEIKGFIIPPAPGSADVGDTGAPAEPGLPKAAVYTQSQESAAAASGCATSGGAPQRPHEHLTREREAAAFEEQSPTAAPDVPTGASSPKDKGGAGGDGSTLARTPHSQQGHLGDLSSLGSPSFAAASVLVTPATPGGGSVASAANGGHGGGREDSHVAELPASALHQPPVAESAPSAPSVRSSTGAGAPSAVRTGPHDSGHGAPSRDPSNARVAAGADAPAKSHSSTDAAGSRDWPDRVSPASIPRSAAHSGAGSSLGAGPSGHPSRSGHDDGSRGLGNADRGAGGAATPGPASAAAAYARAATPGANTPSSASGVAAARSNASAGAAAPSAASARPAEGPGPGGPSTTSAHSASASSASPALGHAQASARSASASSASPAVGHAQGVPQRRFSHGRAGPAADGMASGHTTQRPHGPGGSRKHSSHSAAASGATTPAMSPATASPDAGHAAPQAALHPLAAGSSDPFLQERRKTA